VPAKVIKLVGLKNGGRLSPTNLITFAGTQNGEYLCHKTSAKIDQCKFLSFSMHEFKKAFLWTIPQFLYGALF
jgi:hypothetical protein